MDVRGAVAEELAGRFGQHPWHEVLGRLDDWHRVEEALLAAEPAVGDRSPAQATIRQRRRPCRASAPRPARRDPGAGAPAALTVKTRTLRAAWSWRGDPALEACPFLWLVDWSAWPTPASVRSRAASSLRSERTAPLSSTEGDSQAGDGEQATKCPRARRRASAGGRLGRLGLARRPHSLGLADPLALDFGHPSAGLVAVGPLRPLRESRPGCAGHAERVRLRRRARARRQRRSVDA